MKDEDEAIRLMMIWLAVFSFGLIIADKWNVAAGLLLSILATITVVIIIYLDWRNEQTKERLDNYIDDAGKRIKEVTGHGTRKDL